MKSIYEELKREAEYALNSKSENLVYLTCGKVCLARKLEVITKEQYFEFNEMLVVNGLNNTKAGLE